MSSVELGDKIVVVLFILWSQLKRKSESIQRNVTRWDCIWVNKHSMCKITLEMMMALQFTVQHAIITTMFNGQGTCVSNYLVTIFLVSEIYIFATCFAIPTSYVSIFQIFKFQLLFAQSYPSSYDTGTEFCCPNRAQSRAYSAPMLAILEPLPQLLLQPQLAPNQGSWHGWWWWWIVIGEVLEPGVTGLEGAGVDDTQWHALDLIPPFPALVIHHQNRVAHVWGDP